jgi:hypothetical protein
LALFGQVPDQDLGQKRFSRHQKSGKLRAKPWCREHVDYDGLVILAVDKSELPDTVWAVDQPHWFLEYRYNWERDLKSYREEAPQGYFELGDEVTPIYGPAVIARRFC